jgi:hypothetical protein
MIDPAREIDIAAAILCPGVLCEPQRPVKLNPRWTHLDDLELAEDYPRSSAAVDVLIGADHANKVLRWVTGMPQ